MLVNTCVFDAYGTLFDVNAAARIAANEPNREIFKDVWPSVSNTWRMKQLQYTWLRSMTGSYTDFWSITQNSLDFALEAHKLQNDLVLRERLLALYWELQPYSEVSQMLKELKKNGIKTAILSNGSPEMLNGAVKSSNLYAVIDEIISVETVKIFKPSPLVYKQVEKIMECSKSDVLFVSSNGWDIAGAAGFGFKTAWVNRLQEPIDRLAQKPMHIVQDLKSIPTFFSN
ncbi:haloacid dehalogenase type II [Paracoccaceae bacterium]|nr:haloacid dehalogenase type II [Paracoccaceae bacterium]